jgi:hypothetical protein
MNSNIHTQHVQHTSTSHVTCHTGTCVYSNGDKYAGSWLQDRAHGKGVYTYSGGELYDGDWVHGKKTGRGVFEFGSGDVYKGECLLMMMMNTMMSCVRV